MPARELTRTLALASVVALGHPAGAQVPSQAEQDRILRALPRVTPADEQRVLRSLRTPSEVDLRAANVPGAVNVDALPNPTSKQVDMGRIIEGFESQIVEDQISILPSGPSLVVLVSLSMPEASLKTILRHAKRAGASVVLRGFHGGTLQSTLKALSPLVSAKDSEGVQIDPQAFDRFGVTSTPTFVLLLRGASPQPCAAGTCFASDQFASVAGDVTIDYALNYIARSSPKFSDAAQYFVDKLRRSR